MTFLIILFNYCLLRLVKLSTLLPAHTNCTMYSSHGSVTGNSDLIPLVRGKENEWMERMEMRLGRQQLWEIVSGEEPQPKVVTTNTRANVTSGTPTRSLAINFDEIFRASISGQTDPEPTPDICISTKLTLEAKDWKSRHDRAYYFIKESLSMTEYGLPKCKQMSAYRDDVS